MRHWYQPDAGGALSAIEKLLAGSLSALYRLLWLARSFWTKTLGRPRKANGLWVIAVGNLVAGGAGKTPSVMALGLAMRQAKIPCGLIFRGYRALAEHGPPRVIEPNELAHTPASEIGDEAWLACWRTGLPIAVGKDRYQAQAALKAAHPELTTVILDDGLQQRKLAWDQAVLITDGRGFGNGHCLPAGPLREPIGDLRRFHAWIHQPTHEGQDSQALAAAHAMPTARSLLAQQDVAWIPLAHWDKPSLWLGIDEGIEQFRSHTILAAAGIAVPQRFFASLAQYGLRFHALPLADHDPHTVDHIMQAQQSGRFDVILMTEKDAVKFFARHANVPDNAWALRRDATLNQDFLDQLIHGPQTS